MGLTGCSCRLSTWRGNGQNGCVLHPGNRTGWPSTGSSKQALSTVGTNLTGKRGNVLNCHIAFSITFKEDVRSINAVSKCISLENPASSMATHAVHIFLRYKFGYSGGNRYWHRHFLNIILGLLDFFSWENFFLSQYLETWSGNQKVRCTKVSRIHILINLLN